MEPDLRVSCTSSARPDPFAEAWFPEGTDDPHLALLRVDVDRAQEDKKPKVQLAEIVIGIVRDVPPKSGEQGRIEF